MRIGRLVSAACVVLASLLVIGQTFQSLGLSTAEAREAKQAQKRAKSEREAAELRAQAERKSAKQEFMGVPK